MDAEVFFSGGGGVDVFAGDEDVSVLVFEVLEEVVVVAVSVDDLGAVFVHFEDFADDGVVGFVPFVSSSFEFPAVDEVA